MPVDLKTRLVSHYNDLPLIRAVADVLGMNIETLRRRIREHREYTETIFAERQTPADAEEIRQRLNLIFATRQPLPTRLVAPAPTATKLTNFAYIDPQTDQGQFVEWLHDTRATKPNITVMHQCDAHAPFENLAALQVQHQLVGHIQPDAMAVGSDFSDFAILSPFDHDPEADDEDAADVLDQFEEHWIPNIDALKAASPDTLLFFILGNHELRIWKWIMNIGPEFRRTIMRRFIEIVRYRGVLWLGEYDFARMGPLLVMHGNRHNIHTSKSILEDMGGQVSVMAGHVHRLTSFSIPGEDYTVNGITSGCLCQRIAHYSRGKKQRRPYQLGTAIADVELGGREVQFNNLSFTEALDRVFVRFERHTFEAPVDRPAGLMTYEEYLNAREEGA